MEAIKPTREKGFTAWNPMSNDTDYFGDASQQYMINCRVENLEALVETLKSEGVTIIDPIENYEYGKFVYILMVKETLLNFGKPMMLSMKKC